LFDYFGDMLSMTAPELGVVFERCNSLSDPLAFGTVVSLA
jgi:hypothetical protein